MNKAIRPGPESPPQAVSTPQLSVIVPTFNERDNVTTLFRRLEAALAGVNWEVIFVDDNSPDGTWDVVRALARQDSRVRCVRRIGRRGLSGACIEGILASSAPYAAVIDADLQHDETQLPRMLALLQGGEADLVVGSRYIAGGSAESFNKQRAGISALATEVAKRVLRIKVADPMSGFFMIRSDRFEQLAPQLSTQGFKILLDIVASGRGELRIKEIPYTSAHGCMARANSTRRWRWISWGSCWRNSPATWCRCASSCLRWSGPPACSCISPRCSLRSRFSACRFRKRRLAARWSP
jgi:Glycosyltransferases involved in cell wall biogenesis